MTNEASSQLEEDTSSWIKHLMSLESITQVDYNTLIDDLCLNCIQFDYTLHNCWQLTLVQFFWWLKLKHDSGQLWLILCRFVLSDSGIVQRSRLLSWSFGRWMIWANSRQTMTLFHPLCSYSIHWFGQTVWIEALCCHALISGVLGVWNWLLLSLILNK